MALSITSITSPNNCAHRLVTVDQEGVSRTKVILLSDLDDLIDGFPSQVDAMWALVTLWAAYRRKFGRSIAGVTVA